MCARIFNASFLVFIFGLSACSGGGGSGPPPSYNELQTRLAEIEMQAATTFATTLLPNSGDATYSGVISPNSEGSGFNFQGQMTMEIDFAANMVTGRAENFRLSGDELLQGSLTLNPQALPQNNASAMSGGFAPGSLTGQSVTYDITTLSYDADFYAPDGDVIFGTTLGLVDITNTGGGGTTRDVRIDGTIGLERTD